MASTTRKPFAIGGSKGITIPQEMTIGEEVSMAANDRLLLVDTKGEIPHDKLFEFFLTNVQPSFDSWWAKEKEHLEERQVYIPKSLWDRFYQVSGQLKGSRETYAHAQDKYVKAALLQWVEEREKDWAKSE